ncbi:MAG: histidinol-phosphate transaminase [Armatimonadota bacterium]|nr:histidinol-phosphate transaminase [Armatimonadota bacterium]
MAISDLVGENIQRLKPYSPGKPIEEVEREYGITDIIKLASNENPLGPSPKAVEAMKKAVENVALYPDGSCFSLKKALAKHWGVSEDEVLPGNGSDELIHYIGVTFLSPGDEVIQADPSFVRYESAAILNNCECIMVPLKNFTHDLDAMGDRITERTRLIFVANPNNPTGTAVTHKDAERLISRLPKRVIAVFDEAYYEYVESPEFPRMLEFVKAGANVIVLRTFSKIYGLAGLRVGYAIARPEIIQCLNQVREPFNVNSVAQIGAIASLSDPEQVERSRRCNSEGKRYLYREFEEMGLPYTPTEANFVWVDLKRDSRQVFTELLKRGVIVRTGDIFGYPTYIRVTIGTESENKRFIETLRTVLFG